MHWSYRARILAAAIAVGSVSVLAAPLAANAQVSVSIGFNTFHDRLAAYGDWVYSDRWGEVWIPERVPADFHPYQSDGYWADTDEYGWTWVSDYEWGDIPFHYGRWINDPDDGWLWIPGYVWSPGWVIWRSNGQYTGWMPMPPDDDFLRAGTSVSIGLGAFSINYDDTSSYYGYSRWYGRGYDENRFASNWVFVDTRHMPDHDYRPYVASRGNVANIIRNTRNVTNYTVVNNYYVNKSVDTQQVQRASGRPVAPVPARSVFKNPALVTQVSVGRQVQEQARATRPHGDGQVNSAPKPAPEIVRTLSTRPIERNGKPAQHLFTQQTVAQAPLPPAPANPAPQSTQQPRPGPGNAAAPPQQDRRTPNAALPPQQLAPQPPERPAVNARPAQAAPDRQPQAPAGPIDQRDRRAPNATLPPQQLAPQPPAPQPPQRPAASTPPVQATPDRAPQEFGRPTDQRDRRAPNATLPPQQLAPQQLAPQPPAPQPPERPAASAPPAQPPVNREIPRPARPDAAPAPDRTNQDRTNQDRGNQGSANRAPPPPRADAAPPQSRANGRPRPDANPPRENAAPPKPDAPRDNRGPDDPNRKPDNK
jgi:hypothetical protein